MSPVAPKLPSKVQARGGFGLPPLDPRLFGRLDVYLDGVVVEDVVAVDADAGWLVVDSRNAVGERYVIGDQVATERREGCITISWKQV